MQNEPRMIVPGGPYTPHWNDTDGQRIEAHAAGLLFAGGLWFWCVCVCKKNLHTQIYVGVFVEVQNAQDRNAISWNLIYGVILRVIS